MLSLIVAISENNAIGNNGDLLCHMSTDLQRFKALTTGHTIIMGRPTYLSFPRRPLPNRRHIVLTHDMTFQEEGIEVAHSKEEALNLLPHEEECFVIGGGKIYQQWMNDCDKMYVTHIHHQFDNADTFFPEIKDTEWEIVSEEHYQKDEKNPFDYSFIEYKKRK